MPVPTLVGPRFTLRPFRSSDAVSLVVAMNDERVARKVTHIPYPYTIEHARAWLSRVRDYIDDHATRVDFVIDSAGAVVGSVAFINLEGHKAQVSYWLTPREWGKAIVPEALRLLIAFGFDTLKLERIYAYVYSENTASARVLQKCGFHFEGVHEKEWRKTIDGTVRFFDSNYYAIVRRTRVRSVALRLGYDTLANVARDLTERLARNGIVVGDVAGQEKHDLAIALGGDGTVMRTVSEFSPRGTPTLGINGGDVGFLTVGDVHDIPTIVERIVNGSFTIERRVGLLLRYRDAVVDSIANDVTLRHPSSVANFTVALNGEPLIDAHEADGVIVSTPTGSTAYNVAAGGAIILPSSSNIIVTMNNPMRVSTVPLVLEELSRGGELMITVNSSKRGKPVVLTADGGEFTIEPGESIRVRASSTPLLFATFGLSSYLKALKEKKGFAR